MFVPPDGKHAHQYTIYTGQNAHNNIRTNICTGQTQRVTYKQLHGDGTETQQSMIMLVIMSCPAPCRDVPGQSVGRPSSKNGPLAHHIGLLSELASVK